MTTDVFLYHELSNLRIHDKIYKSVMLRGTPCEDKFDNSGQRNLHVKINSIITSRWSVGPRDKSRYKETSVIILMIDTRLTVW